eukprot:357283-Rhodomonas_salina.1
MLGVVGLQRTDNWKLISLLQQLDGVACLDLALPIPPCLLAPLLLLVEFCCAHSADENRSQATSMLSWEQYDSSALFELLCAVVTVPRVPAVVSCRQSSLCFADGFCPA